MRFSNIKITWILTPSPSISFIPIQIRKLIKKFFPYPLSFLNYFILFYFFFLMEKKKKFNIRLFLFSRWFIWCSLEKNFFLLPARFIFILSFLSNTINTAHITGHNTSRGGMQPAIVKRNKRENIEEESFLKMPENYIVEYLHVTDQQKI